MDNIVLKNKYLSIKEIAKITEISERTLKYRCKACKYLTRTVPSVGGSCGMKYEILVSSLEPELQEKILYTPNSRSVENNPVAPVSLDFTSINQNLQLTEDAARVSSFSSENRSNISNTYKHGSDNILPFSLVSNNQRNLSIGDNLTRPLKQMVNTVPVSLDNRVVPEETRKVALAKYDALCLWQEYRADRAGKKEADNEFLEGYNKGFLAPDLYNMTGKLTLKTLYRWKKLTEGNGYTSLIPNYNYTGYLELNTSLTDEEIEGFKNLYYNDARMNIGAAYNLLKFYFEQQGKPIHSESVFRKFVNYVNANHKDFAVISREGTKAYNDKVGMYIHRDISDVNPGDVLVADGNKLDFMVLNPFTGRPCRATLVVYLDWISFDVAGYEIMISENSQCISSALRNSILRLGKIPKMVYMDNGKAFRGSYFTGCKNLKNCGFKGIYGNLGINLIIANAYSGRSKVVERFFRNFVQSFPPLISSYIGNCIENRPAHCRRDEKFQKELHKNDKIPTIEQAKMMLDAWLEYYRTRPCPHDKTKTIGEVFKSGCGTGVDVDMLDELMLAGDVRTLKRNIIRILGLEYQSPALHGKEMKVLVRYSLFDITKVRVYTLKNEFICEAPLVTYVPAIAKEGSALDMYTYKMQLKQQKELKNMAHKKAKAIMGGKKGFVDFGFTDVIETTPVRKLDKPKPKLEITIYENIHKEKANKPKYEI